MSLYAFDPEFDDVLAIIAAIESVDWSDPEAIKRSRTGSRLSVLSGVSKGDPTPSEDRLIAGLDGDPDVGVRVYRPSTPMVSPSLKKPLSMTVSFCPAGALKMSVKVSMATKIQDHQKAFCCWETLSWTPKH